MLPKNPFSLDCSRKYSSNLIRSSYNFLCCFSDSKSSLKKFEIYFLYSLISTVSLSIYFIYFILLYLLKKKNTMIIITIIIIEIPITFSLYLKSSFKIEMVSSWCLWISSRHYLCLVNSSNNFYFAINVFSSSYILIFLYYLFVYTLVFFFSLKKNKNHNGINFNEYLLLVNWFTKFFLNLFRLYFSFYFKKLEFFVSNFLLYLFFVFIFM